MGEACAGFTGRVPLGNGAGFQHSQYIHNGLPSWWRWFIIYRAGHSHRVVGSGPCGISILEVAVSCSYFI